MEKIVRRKVSERQEGLWSDFCSSHPDLKVAQDCLNNVHPEYFWSLANQYPDLVKCLHTQVTVMCNFGFNGRQEGLWSDFCSNHPDLKVAQDCLNNVHPEYFWSLANQYPDLVKCLHTQVTLMCNFGFNGYVPWLRDTDGANCFICKHTIDDNSHFVHNCPSFKDYFALLWHKLKVKVHKSNPVNGSQISNFADSLVTI